jgi:type III secretory pathway component EscR
MISELRRGFEIGFLIALPFLVIDMIVSTIVMSNRRGVRRTIAPSRSPAGSIRRSG